jgi:hypothetical protein
MRSEYGLERLRGVPRRAFFLGVVCSLCVTGILLAPTGWSDDPDEGEEDPWYVEDEVELIQLRRHRDMMYGSDDYFSDDFDLSFVDGREPSGRTKTTAPAEETVARPTGPAPGTGETPQQPPGEGPDEPPDEPPEEPPDEPPPEPPPI